MKELSDKEIQDLLKSRFEDFKAPTSGDSWTELNAALDEAGNQGAILNYMKVGLAVLVVISSLIWFFQDETPYQATENLGQSNQAITKESVGQLPIQETPTIIASAPIDEEEASTPFDSKNDPFNTSPNQPIVFIPIIKVQENSSDDTNTGTELSQTEIESKSQNELTNFDPLIPSRSELLVSISTYRLNTDLISIDSTKTIKKNSELFFDLSSFLLYDRLLPNQNDALFFQNINSDLDLTERIGFKSKFGIVKPINALIELEFGVSYLLLQRNLSYSYQNTILDFVESQGSTPNSIKSETKSAVHGLGVNLGFQHKIGSKPYYQSVGLSLDVARMLNSKVIQIGDANREVFAEYQQFLNISYLTKRNLSGRYSLRIQPYLTYSISRTLPEAPIQVKPFGGGITIGVSREN